MLTQNFIEKGAVMAKVCVVAENKADVKCFKVTQEFKADLLVYEVDKDFKAKHDGLWYFEDRDSKATSTIAWVSQESKADLKVMFVDKDFKAKWKKPHKLQNRL